MTWSPATLAGRLGGDEDLVHELVDLFLAEYPHLLQAIRANVAVGDAQGIRRSAHKLRGSVTNFIDDGPTATAFALERAGAESRLDTAPALFGQLERELEALAAAMRGAA
jgi:two-component system sensor histidine kinase/response regulator